MARGFGVKENMKVEITIKSLDESGKDSEHLEETMILDDFEWDEGLDFIGVEGEYIKHIRNGKITITGCKLG